VAGLYHSDRVQTFLYDFRLRRARHTRLWVAGTTEDRQRSGTIW